jgi:hypothetical protein
MIDYRKELAEIERLLGEKRYEECSMKCGKRIELVLKDLARVYLSKTSEDPRHPPTVKMQRAPLERQSLGALARLFKDEGILRFLVDRQDPNYRELRAFDLDMIVHIRNKTAHDRQDDIHVEKSDALLLYGSLIKLLAITGLLAVEISGKHPVLTMQDDGVPDEMVQYNAEKTEELPSLESNSSKIVITPTKDDEEKLASRPQTDLEGKAQAPDSGRTIILYSNKISGRNFLYENHVDTNTLSLITPTGDIKSLKENLFDEYGEFTEAEAVEAGLITTNQLAKHRSGEETSLSRNDQQNASWSEEITKVSRHQRSSVAPAQHYSEKKISQDELIPHIIRVLQKYGGRARKDKVEQEIYHIFKDFFGQAWYQGKVSHGVPRWRHYIAWAKERAKKKGLIKAPGDSGRGYWELTDGGRKY